ncbi:LysR family transcriptional regulator [Lutimaribacter marinistellae]|uniref:LysR family transcriptional regulator n=1 Tax=Lutimaribacter marinistellae TaxID=1820329 RepID=A0ABV7TAV9_9RHOB
MRLPLSMLEVFAAIARHGSLRAAADALGLKPSTVSHQLKSLEDHLDTALFIRTTRSISLTEAGRALIRGAGPAFDQLAEAVESARTTGHAARGTLRLAMPEFVYHLFVAPALTGFCAKYPEIELELSLTDALSDILGEELHAGFRLGDRIAQDMVAVRLTPPLALAVAASPDYLAKHGAPHTPRDLLQHNCIRYRFQSSGRIAPWVFEAAGDPFTVDVQGGLVTNTIPASIDLAKRGLGKIYTFRYCISDELFNGTLVSVLEEHLGTTPGIFLYFPREYRSMMALKLFREHLGHCQTEIRP